MCQRCLKRLESKTYRVDHSPNCPSPYLVRLVGKGCATLYAGYYRDKECTDYLGFGKTLSSAAHRAFIAQGTIFGSIGRKRKRPKPSKTPAEVR